MRWFSLLGAMVLVASSCTVGGSPAPPTGAGAEARIGVAEPQPVIWQRQVGGQTLLGLTAQAEPLEVAMIRTALEQVPDAIKRQADVRNLVRAADAERLDPATKAFSRGPDIYLIDRTFEGTTRLDLAYTLAHELAHVAQFNALDPEFVDLVLDGAVDSLDADRASLAVADFVADIGWEAQPGGGWVNPTAATGTTPYGATGPSEDMAESVALVALGRANELSPDRVRWVEDWAGVSADEMARGKPWRPPGAVAFNSPDPFYDEAGVGTLGGVRVEPMYLLLADDGTAFEDIVNEVATQLRGRAMAGVLETLPDERVPRTGGRMVGPSGSLLWVELWDFRAAAAFTNPPPGVVLTYVDAWS